MHNSFCALIAHVWYFKILTWLRGFRVKVANFHDSIVSQFPEETRAQRKPNLTKCRKRTRKPRSHVRILIYRTWAIRRLDGLYTNGPGHACVGRLHRRLWALSFAKLNPHDKWNDQDKMGRHCSIETTSSIASKPSICVSTEILVAVQQGRTENENFWKWNGKSWSDQTNRPRGPPLEVDHFDRKIYTQTKASHLFLDPNFENFVIMESTPYYSWCLKDVAFRAEPSCIL